MKYHIDTNKVAHRCHEAKSGTIEIAPKEYGFRSIRFDERSTLTDWQEHISGIVGDVHQGITQHHGAEPDFTYS